MDFPDIGVGRFSEMLEERFGRLSVTILLALIAAALAVGAISFILNSLMSIWSLAWGLFKNFSMEVTIESATSFMIALTIIVLVFAAALLLSMYLLARVLRFHRIPQSALNELALLRQRAITDLYSAAKPENDEKYENWKNNLDQWHQELLTYVEKYFPKSDLFTLQSIGPIMAVHYSQAYNCEHDNLLSRLAKRIEHIEGMLASYRR